ncbi:glycoside hydrolase family 130 protein [candidate division KSB1 bacterium]|nr:glycoside hydrolase family 130 protein [candidate division KSB1 bacterium]
MKIVNGQSIPNLPWEDRPAGSSEVMWRYSNNPVIPRDILPTSNSVFNSAVIPYKGEFAGVFRIDDTTRKMQLHRGFSKDGLKWNIEPNPIKFQCDVDEISEFVYGYDPRVVVIDGRYYVMWCNYYHGPTIGLAWSDDFETFHQVENAFLPFNRNGVLFPRKIDDKFVLLSRPSDSGHTPFGDIFLSQSPDLEYWGKHRWVMGPVGNSWQYTKIGGGPAPIETSEGWLMIYHGVLQSCNGFVYSAGVALLDLDEPWKVIGRAKPYVLNPRALYECVGDVANVVFPCAALCDQDSNKLAVYYGAADTVVGLAFAKVDELVDLIKKTS